MDDSEELLDHIEKMKDRYRVQTYGTFKTIDLTDEQYKRLILMLNVGCRIVDDNGEELERGLHDIQQYIMSYFNQFNASHLVTCDDVYGYYKLTDDLMEVTNTIVDDYDDFSTKFQLSNFLGNRDLMLIMDLELASPEEIEKSQLFYWNEFEENDFDNLWLKKEKKAVDSPVA